MEGEDVYTSLPPFGFFIGSISSAEFSNPFMDYYADGMVFPAGP